MTISDEELRTVFATVDVANQEAPTADEISALLDGNGEEAARLATLARLVSTPDGRRELNMLRALRDGFASDEAADRATPPARHEATTALEFPTRVARPMALWLRPFGLAAAALLITLIGVEQLVSRPRTPVFRSGTTSLALVSPVDGAQSAVPMAFVWRRIADASYDVELYSTDGRELARQQTRDTVFLLPAGTATGDYRWWVTARLEDGTQVRSATRRVLIRP